MTQQLFLCIFSRKIKTCPHQGLYMNIYQSYNNLNVHQEEKKQIVINIKEYIQQYKKNKLWNILTNLKNIMVKLKKSLTEERRVHAITHNAPKQANIWGERSWIQRWRGDTNCKGNFHGDENVLCILFWIVIILSKLLKYKTCAFYGMLHIFQFLKNWHHGYATSKIYEVGNSMG